VETTAKALRRHQVCKQLLCRDRLCRLIALFLMLRMATALQEHQVHKHFLCKACRQMARLLIKWSTIARTTATTAAATALGKNLLRKNWPSRL
jgi:hypothetical protein